MARPISGQLSGGNGQDFWGLGGQPTMDPSGVISQGAANIGQAGAASASAISRGGGGGRGIPNTGEGLAAGMASAGQSIGAGLQARYAEQQRQKMLTEERDRADRQNFASLTYQGTMAKIAMDMQQYEKSEAAYAAPLPEFVRLRAGMTEYDLNPDGSIKMVDGKPVPNPRAVEVDNYFKQYIANAPVSPAPAAQFELAKARVQYAKDIGRPEYISQSDLDMVNNKAEAYEGWYREVSANPKSSVTVPIEARPTDVSGKPVADLHETKAQASVFTAYEGLFQLAKKVSLDNSLAQVGEKKIAEVTLWADQTIKDAEEFADAVVGGTGNINVKNMRNMILTQAITRGEFNLKDIITGANKVTQVVWDDYEKGDITGEGLESALAVERTLATLVTEMSGTMELFQTAKAKPEVLADLGVAGLSPEQIIDIADNVLPHVQSALRVEWNEARNTPGFLAFKIMGRVGELAGDIANTEIVPPGSELLPGQAYSISDALMRAVARRVTGPEFRELQANVLGLVTIPKSEAPKQTPQAMPQATNQSGAMPISPVLGSPKDLVGGAISSIGAGAKAVSGGLENFWNSPLVPGSNPSREPVNWHAMGDNTSDAPQYQPPGYDLSRYIGQANPTVRAK